MQLLFYVVPSIWIKVKISVRKQLCFKIASITLTLQNKDNKKTVRKQEAWWNMGLGGTYTCIHVVILCIIIYQLSYSGGHAMESKDIQSLRKSCRVNGYFSC